MARIDMSRVYFTDHAVQRFCERYKFMGSKDRLRDPEKTARKLLAKAKEDTTIDSVARVRRLISNGYQDVMYLANSGWRFVIREESGRFIVLTVERQNSSSWD